MHEHVFRSDKKAHVSVFLKVYILRDQWKIGLSRGSNVFVYEYMKDFLLRAVSVWSDWKINLWDGWGF